MRIKYALLTAVLLCFACGNSFAYLNATYLNTTVVLNSTTTARVIETITINMSNASVAQYLQDRQALNLTLSDWASTLHTNLLIQHIISPNSSVGSFTLLPGPLLYSNSRTAGASLTMTYMAYNITSVTNIGPRKFEYIFDSSSLDFEHTASGQSLPSDARFNIIVPKGTEIVSVYPQPDFPPPSFLGSYNNETIFSWYEAEPLSKFQFSYIVTESLQNEVTTYFSQMYVSYRQQIYTFLIMLVSIMSIYIYVKVFT